MPYHGRQFRPRIPAKQLWGPPLAVLGIVCLLIILGLIAQGVKRVWHVHEQRIEIVRIEQHARLARRQEAKAAAEFETGLQAYMAPERVAARISAEHQRVWTEYENRVNQIDPNHPPLYNPFTDNSCIY